MMEGLTQAYCNRLFDAFSSNGASADPEWLRAARRRAMDTFDTVGFPTTRQEDWRFTNVRGVLGHPFELAGPAAADPAALARFRYREAANQVVVANGRFSAELSDLNGLPDGVIVMSLREAVATHEDLVRAHLAGDGTPANGFAALNAAFASDGVFVHIPDGVEVTEDLHLFYLTTPGQTPVMTHPRTIVTVGNGAAAGVVETYAGVGPGVYLTNAATQTRVGDGARLHWYRVQRETAEGFHVASTHSVQGRDSHYAFVTVPFGGSLSRHDIHMVMNGEGSEGTLNGLYVMGGRQHVDHQTVIEHARPHCQSFEYFNGILDDRARAVFNGRIIVQPGAQKTDSKQTNNNLLLSETARADSQPQLEIYADDVRCTHGATLGPLDDTSTFYLQSRGLDATAARRLLTYGFAREILDGIKADDVRQMLENLVLARLERVQT